jgi:hypothetical protein
MKNRKNSSSIRIIMMVCGIMAFLLISGYHCSADSNGDKTPFEGTWERIKNEMTRWTFTGNTYEVYWELEGEAGEHYYKGTFTYEELSPGKGTIIFEQTHSAVTSGAWSPAEDTEMTSYRFVDATTLEIMSAKYRKK